MLSWHRHLLPAWPGTSPSCPGEGAPSLHCSHPWALAHAVAGTKQVLLVPRVPGSSQQPYPVGAMVLATVQVKKLSLGEVWCPSTPHPHLRPPRVSVADQGTVLFSCLPLGFLCETFHQPSPHQVFMDLPVKGQAIPIR